jgi:hypothetical protein
MSILFLVLTLYFLLAVSKELCYAPISPITSLLYSKELMSPVLKNILTLIFFVMFVSWIGRAEAHDWENYQLILRAGPSNSMINFTVIEKCEYKHSTWCVLC